MAKPLVLRKEPSPFAAIFSDQVWTGEEEESMGKEGREEERILRETWTIALTSWSDFEH